jgi:hypothetical protein
VPAVLVVLGALVWFYATSTPRYALYRLAGAMQEHNVAEAERYFDVDRIVDHAAEVIVADYLARQPAPTSEAEVNGRRLVTDMAKRRLRPQLLTRVRTEIRRSVERAGIQSTALVLPMGAVAVFRAFVFSWEGPDAWVTYQDQAQGPIRFRMSHRRGRGWQISEFDPDWVRRRVHEDPPRIR